MMEVIRTVRPIYQAVLYTVTYKIYQVISHRLTNGTCQHVAITMYGERALMRSDTDIDECADNSGGCSPKANCINRPGSFTCTCLDGYTGDGFSCAGKTASKISHSVLLAALKVVTDRQTTNDGRTDDDI